MTRAITVRLDYADHEALARQADRLRVQPGTLARIVRGKTITPAARWPDISPAARSPTTAAVGAGDDMDASSFCSSAHGETCLTCTP